MFRCELSTAVPKVNTDASCKGVQPPRTRAVKVAIEYREKEYPTRPKANKLRVGRKMKHFDDPGGAGFEIFKEVLSCRSCAGRFEEMLAAGDVTDGR